MNCYRCLLFVVAMASASLPAWTASANIGIASAVSAYSVNGASVKGGTDLADGTALRTTLAPGDIHLANGATLLLATRSASTVYRDHVSLNAGALRVANFEEYPVATRSLQISSESPDTKAVIRIEGKHVLVASLGGTVRVSDGGAMLTRVAAGTRMAFDDQTATPQTHTPKDQSQGQTQTGASSPTHGTTDADQKALIWSIVAIAGAAAVIGIIAAVK